MKKPKRTLTNGELSQIVMKVCILLGAICMIPIIAGAESLDIKFKVIDLVFLIAISIGIIVEFVFKYFSFRNSIKNSEENDTENDVSNDKGEHKK